MAFSTLVFDTLDVATRLGRYIFEELTHWKTFIASALGALLTLALPTFFILSAQEGSWIKFWTLFGASNQLLAAMTLLSVSVWLYKSKRPVSFTLIPMIFILVITFAALYRLALSGFQGEIQIGSASFINSLCASAMILLACFLIFKAGIQFARKA
jgi:carbon starvation protein